MTSNLFVFSNCNNDLSYYGRISSSGLVQSLKPDNAINVFGLFTYKDIDKGRTWTNYPVLEGSEEEYSCFSYCENLFSSYSIEEFYTPLDNNLKYLDIVKFLKFFSCEEKSNNIVVVSGHGGLFQSLLDMSGSSFFALNTIKLCNDIKNLPIDLLILDMCSMNYLEIAYQLLHASKISNIIFFKGLTPIEGLNLSDLYHTISQCNGDITAILETLLLKSDDPLFVITKSATSKLTSIKSLLNAIAYNILTSSYEKNTALQPPLKDLCSNLVIEGVASSKISGLPLKFIGYELKEDEEKSSYRCYDIFKDSFWGDIVCADVTTPTNLASHPTIPFTKENFYHLILLHNFNISKEAIENITQNYSSFFVYN